MNHFLRFTTIVLPILYFIIVFLYARFFYDNDVKAEKRIDPLFRVTLILHFLAIFGRGWHLHHYPLASVFEIASVVAFALAMIYRYIESRLNNKNTGYFIMILVFAIQLFSSIFIEPVYEIPEILKSPLFDFHSTFAALGYTALILAAIYSLMFILLFHDIKTSRFGILFERLPSLETLSGMIYKSSVLGLTFLSIAILSGHIFLKISYDTFFQADFKIFSVYVVWTIYLLVILGKKAFHWPPRIMAYLSIAGVFLIIISTLLVNLFLTKFHKFF